MISEFPIRSWMLLLEATSDEVDEPTEAETAAPEPDHGETILLELGSVVEKMRAYLHDGDTTDFAAGMEAGMARAADMIESAMKRASGGGER